MAFRIENEILNGIKVFVPDVLEDKRGFFMETYRKDKFNEIGIDEEFVQENHSFSRKGVIRGLHFQFNPPVSKLIRAVNGEAYLVAVDIRKNSDTLGKWHGDFISGENKRQIWVPEGFASGFCALRDYTEILYKYNALYNPEGESNIIWDDAEIGIKWPSYMAEPILSDKDKKAQTLSEWLKREESNYFRLR